MQSTRLITRPKCRARDAFDAAAAVRAAFHSNARSQAPSNETAKTLDQYNDLIDSASRVDGWYADYPAEQARKKTRRNDLKIRSLRLNADPERDFKNEVDPEPFRSKPSATFIWDARKVAMRRHAFAKGLDLKMAQPSGGSFESGQVEHQIDQTSRGLAVIQNLYSTDPTTLKRISSCLGSRVMNLIDAMPRETGLEEYPGLSARWKEQMSITGEIANAAAHRNARLDDHTFEILRRAAHYHPRVAIVEESPVKEPMAVPWAIDPSRVPDLEASRRLDLEIGNFARFMQLSPAERAARRAVRARTEALAREILAPYLQIEQFGSEITGLATATSDIDMRVCGGKPHLKEYGYLRPMTHLSTVMGRSDEYICVAMRTGRFSIINAQHKATGIDIQIVCSPSTARQQQLTKQYLAELPHLRDLYFVLRTMLSMRGLLDVFNGGTGSYGTMIMLVAALKRGLSCNLPGLDTPSAQLLHFLDFYANFETDKYGLTLTPSPKLFKKHDGKTVPLQAYIQAAHHRNDSFRGGQWAISQKRELQPYLLCLQDPAKQVNDLGRKSNATLHLQHTLAHLRSVMSKEPVSGESQLLPLVGRCHEVYFERRRKVEEYGQAILDGQDAKAARAAPESDAVKPVAAAAS